ncbi:MAG TPA: hypothetical protein VJS11_11620 [Acidobacteriaceae bacterium]|nr:hypothetical protein [Acidobacteriaceae bacterium]
MKHPIWVLGLLAAACAVCPPAWTQSADIVPHVVYVCNGEHIYVDSCNMRDTSDSSTCMVAHPDHLKPPDIVPYTYMTRAALRAMLPTCQQPPPQQLAAARARQQRQQAAEDAQIKQAEASPAMPTRAQVIESLQPKDPAERQMNRCISAGRLPASCTGNALLGGFTKMLGSVLPGGDGSGGRVPPSGPVMSGVYQGAGNWRLDFVDGGVLVNCAMLNPNEETYSIQFDGGRTTLIIHTKPKPLDLTFHADGTIVGPPGPVTIDGVIATGYHSGDAPNAMYKDAAGNEYDAMGNKLQTTAGYSTFSPRRATCPAINLRKSASVGIQTMQTDLLKTAFGGDKGSPTPPGIRMQGIYAAPTGFSVQFFPESAVLGCGPDAARAYPYTVVAGPAGGVVRIDAPDHPLTLAIRANNALDPGSAAPYQVHGRLMVGQNGNGGYAFIPNEQACGLAVLAPSASIPASGGSTPRTPAR